MVLIIPDVLVGDLEKHPHILEGLLLVWRAQKKL